MLHLHAWAPLHIPQLLPDARHQARQISLRVEVVVFLKLPQGRKERFIRVEMLDERGVRGELVVHLYADAHARLVGPAPGHVGGGVAAAAEDEERDVEGLGVVDAGAVGLDAEVEAAEAVAAEGVGAALEDDGRGAVGGNAGADDVLEEADVLVVFDAVVEGHVEAVVSAGVAGVGGAGGVEGPGAGEVRVLVVLVEGEGHDAVGGPEGLLDTVAVVDVDVDIEDAGVVEEELQGGEDDVVDVAEAAGFGFLGVVQAAGPVDGDFRLVGGEFTGSVEGGAGV